MYEITPMDTDGTQRFILGGKVRYAIYTLDSLRGTRYGVYPQSHTGREYIVKDLTEAFGLAIDEMEKIVADEEMFASAQR